MCFAFAVDEVRDEYVVWAEVILGAQSHVEIFSSTVRMVSPLDPPVGP